MDKLDDSYHEQEQQKVEAPKEQQVEQKDDNAKINVKAEKTISKVMDCTQERCNIARMQETKTGTVSKAHLQCNMCKNFNKDNEKLEKIERKLLTLIDNNVLHNIIQHNSSPQTKVTLKQFMKDELHTISTKPAAVGTSL